MRDLNAELGAIMATIPHGSDESDRQQYATLFSYCAASIHGGLDWPDRVTLRDVVALPNGFGCWLQDAATSIETAQLDDESRAQWHVALNGAKALLQFSLIGGSETPF